MVGVLIGLSLETFRASNELTACAFTVGVGCYTTSVTHPHQTKRGQPSTRDQKRFLSGNPIQYYRPRGSAEIRHLIDEGFQAFNAGRDIVLHCNGRYNEMLIVAKNSPLLSSFVIKKTSQLLNIIR